MVQVTADSSIATITLALPERRNALSLAMMKSLIEALDMASQQRDCRAIILSAEGPVFCSGHDLRELEQAGLEEAREIFDVCTRLMETIQSIRPPVIAQVQGLATAAGCQLVATCDLAIASETAAFATPGVKIGLFCTTPMVALTRAIGRKRAMEMLMTGRTVPAKEAAEWGLINRAVPEADLSLAVRTLAGQIAAASAYTVSVGKRAFYAQADLAQPDAYGYAKEAMSSNTVAPDAREGIRAFLQKRAPAWNADGGDASRR